MPATANRTALHSTAQAKTTAGTAARITALRQHLRHETTAILAELQARKMTDEVLDLDDAAQEFEQQLANLHTRLIHD